MAAQGSEKGGAGRARGEGGAHAATLREIGHNLAKVPEGFNLNPKIAKQLEA